MKFGKKTIALIGAVAMLSSVAACGSTSAGDGGSTGSSDKKVELTVWSWDSTLPRTVKGFEAKNPNIKVKVTNAGTNKDEYNALSNAIEAGSGAPDIAQIEYYALPEYVIRGHLENLSDLGASDFKDFYTPGTWSSVNINDGVYALPMDSGPMAWFYNKDVFDKAGVDPTQVRTWDDFDEAVPAYFAGVFMAICYSISYGIAAGFIFYCITKICKKQAKQIHPILWVATILFVINFVLLAII